MMPTMRTTLTLDDDLAQELHQRARREGESFKAVLNAALRKGLRVGSKPKPLPRFEVEASSCGFHTGIDVHRLNQLNDEIETQEFRLRLETGLKA